MRKCKINYSVVCFFIMMVICMILLTFFFCQIVADTSRRYMYIILVDYRNHNIIVL